MAASLQTSHSDPNMSVCEEPSGLRTADRHLKDLPDGPLLRPLLRLR